MYLKNIRSIILVDPSLCSTLQKKRPGVWGANLSFVFEKHDDYILMVGDGVVSMSDRADCVKRMLTDDSLPVPSNVLIDVCKVQNAPLVDDISRIRLMIQLLQSKFLGKVAILNTVVGHSFLSHAIAVGVWDNCRAVHTFRDALDWFAE